VAGDPANPLAPTYAAFQKLLEPEAAPVSPSTAAYFINQRLDHSGNVTTFVPPELRTHTSYDTVTHHYIADVFRDYATLVGPVYRGSYVFVDEPVFYGQSLYIFGRPITEPYWTRALVGGTEKDIMVQLFERRVLTYTPSNSPANRVEMGNVGQHYFAWRYGTPRQGETCRQGMPAPTTMRSPALFPNDTSQATAAYTSSGAIPQGGAGNVFAYTTGVQSLYSAPALSLDGGLAVFSAGMAGLIAVRLDDDFEQVCEAWRYTPSQTDQNYGFGSTPLLYNGLAIAGDSTGTLYAVRLSDGAPVWTNTAPHRTGIYGTPITDGERIYFAARTDEYPIFPIGPSGGHLYAVNLTDGSTAWESPNIPGARGQVIFGFDDNLFFGAFDGQVQAYTRSGQPVPGWPSQHVGFIATGPTGVEALNYASGHLYASHGGVYVLDRDGKLVDSYNSNSFTTPAVVGDTVYVGQEYVQEGKTPDGMVIIHHPFEVKALNAANLAEEKFTFRTDFPNGSNLTVVDGYIYFWAEERFFQVKADGSGSNRQMFLGGEGGGTPVVANGRVYVTSGDGNFYIVK
jgi:outer membrane protein assembly factor BamB